LWKGAIAFYAYLNANFNLKQMCMWSIHNFLAYDFFVGCVTKGQVGYPPCGATTKFRSLNFLKKMVYCGTCRYLLENHPYRRAKMAFDGKIKIRVAPIPMSSIATIARGEERETWLTIP
jgi:hypothetical protein